MGHGWFGCGWLVLGSGALSECLQRSPRHHFEQSLANSSRQTVEERGGRAEEKKKQSQGVRERKTEGVGKERGDRGGRGEER